MAISRADLGSVITAMCMRNRTMGIPALEDGLFVNLLIFDYLFYILRLGVRGIVASIVKAEVMN